MGTPLEIRYTADWKLASRSPDQLARDAEQVRIRRGAFADRESWRRATDAERMVAAALAAQRAASAPIVFSHESAAAVLGIWVIGALPARPQALARPGSGRRSNRAVRWRQAELTADELAVVDGVLVTDPVRTAIDLAASRSLESGVAALDSVMWCGGRAVSKAAIERRIEARRPFPGVRSVDAAMTIATGWSGSPLESLGMTRIAQGGYERPEQQRAWEIAGNRYESDLYFPGRDAIGELDGRAKYRDPVFLAGRTAEEAVWDEKLREDALRSAATRFFRATWADVWAGDPFFSTLDRVGIRRVTRRIAFR